MLSNQLLQDGIVTGNSDVFHIRNPVVLQLFENQNLSECLVFYSPTTVIGACSVHPLSFSCFLLSHYTYHMPSNMFYIRFYISYKKYISQWNHIKFQQHFSKLFIIQFSVPILGKNNSAGWHVQLGIFKTLRSHIVNDLMNHVQLILGLETIACLKYTERLLVKAIITPVRFLYALASPKTVLNIQ